MHVSKSTQLIKSLLEYCDISSRQFEEENKVLLSIDYELNILIIVEHALIYLIGTVGIINKDETFYHNLLKANFKSLTHISSRYSVDPATGELIVSLSVDSYSIELNQFIKTVEDFISFCEKWMRTLNTGSTDIPNDLSSDSESSIVTRKESNKEKFDLLSKTIETHYIKP